ncbi:chitobiase/beta-hexosaminidase C-terminal domain-containing protein [Roseibacillus persicicus]|nr:chitobiase/beta-hexosaminidase C-terminal domain-containing protein [Roseibacillus persicicus]
MKERKRLTRSRLGFVRGRLWVAAIGVLQPHLCLGQLLINEFSATNSDRLLVRETGQYPRVGNTVPWQSASYDDSQWETGDGPFGFGSVGGVSLGTNVSAEMQNQTPTLYLRKSFNVSSGIAASTSNLELKVRYNDGFIAYLNGVEIARRNMALPGMFAYRDQPAYNSSSSSALTTITVGVASSLLQDGENQLAIQVHNLTAGNSSLLLAADLELANGTTVVDGSTSWNYFAGLAEPSGGLVDYGLLAREAEAAPDVVWATTSFDDSTWDTGVGPVGYDSANPPHYVVGVPGLITRMRNITPSIYARIPFSVTAAEADSAFPLSLLVDYDDGMIVYLNGTEVYRGNMGEPGAFASHTDIAGGNHPATGDGGNPMDRSQMITLGEARGLLLAGDNVLAIQLHNASLGSSDLIGEATLSSTGTTARNLVSPTDSLRYFVGLAEPIDLEDIGENDIGTIEDPPDSENDWIEIRNTSSGEISLDGWSMSDDPSDPTKWEFPAGTTIPGNGYLVVVASSLDYSPAGDGTTYAHTNFKLSSTGEDLLLVRPDGQIEDELPGEFPSQTWRYTYGRQADGTFGYLALGTPGAENAGSVLGEAPARPEVGLAGGFYPSPLSVSLTTPTPSAIIRYTTDGTDPLGGMIYGGPIQVASNTVIRARSFLPDAIPSESVTHTYLINQGPAYQSIPAMCLSGDPALTFYGPNAADGPANGEGVFAINGGSYDDGVWSANGQSSAYNHAAASGRSNEKYGAMEYLPLTGEPLRTELGMRVAGSGHTRARLRITDAMDEPFTSTSTSATKFEKPSMNIFFRPEFGERPIDYPFFGSNTVTEFDSLRVRAGKNDWYNPFIKDELMRRLFINTGQVGSYGTIHTLWINGVYKGYYNTAERIREGFMQAHYNSSESWDVQQVNSFSSGDPTNWNKMLNYLRTADLTTTAGYAGVLDYLDVDNYLDYILVNAYAAMGDWPHNNWIAARERSSTGRWRFYVWDAEGAFGFSERSTSTNTFTEQLTLPSTRFPTADAQTTTSQYIQAIYTLLKQSPEFRLRMADRAQKHLYNGGALVTSEITEVYNELRSEVTPIIEETIGGSFRDNFYNGWIANNTRFNALTGQLVSENAWPATSAPTFNQYGGEISQGFQLTIGNPNSGGTIYYTTDGSDPRGLGGIVLGDSYSSPISLSEDTRVRARVLASGVWSPEIDFEFTLPFAYPTFLPLISADWTADDNWSSAPGPFPNSVDAIAVIPGVSGDSRNANIREPVTLGRLIFELADSERRSRVRDRSTGNTLTFSDTSGEAEILVTGNGEGYAELEVEAGVTLTDSVRLDVVHRNGDGDYGALRLRSDWNGPGGLTKSGLGIASLTGDGKDYLGATVVEEGVLQVTEPAAPSATSSVSVLSGGQLRLTSGTGPNEPPRDYAFGGTLGLAGFGRGSEISDNEGNGKKGALRYEPGDSNNVAVISSRVELAAPSEIHVAGSSNSLALLQPLGGEHALTKSGGGSLYLGGDQSARTYPIAVSAGTLEIQGDLGSTIALAPSATLRGFGRTAAISGEGSIVLEQTLLEAPSSSASHYSFVFGASGSPSLGLPAATTNSTIILEAAPTGVLSLDFYLIGSAQGAGRVSQGGFLVPFGEDLENSLSSATVRVYTHDLEGTHQFGGENWSLVPEFTLTSVAADLGQAAPFEQIRILELTNGDGPPTSFEAWRQANFDAAELADSQTSGPLASPYRDGVSNLMRYALGVPMGASALDYLPRLVSGAAGVGLEFPFETGRDDLQVFLESSENLEDWSEAAALFDSAEDYPPEADGKGWILIEDTRAPVLQRFYRIRVVAK